MRRALQGVVAAAKRAEGLTWSVRRSRVLGAQAPSLGPGGAARGGAHVVGEAVQRVAAGLVLVGGDDLLQLRGRVGAWARVWARGRVGACVRMCVRARART